MDSYNSEGRCEISERPKAKRYITAKSTGVKVNVAMTGRLNSNPRLLSLLSPRPLTLEWSRTWVWYFHLTCNPNGNISSSND